MDSMHVSFSFSVYKYIDSEGNTTSENSSFFSLIPVH